METQGTKRPARRRTIPPSAFGAFALALGLTVVLQLGVPFLGWLFAWIAGSSLSAFLLYGFDKWLAKGSRRRVPERVLLAIALAGGSPGALGAMRVFRHKTLKKTFQFALWGIVIVQVAAAVLYFAGRF